MGTRSLIHVPEAKKELYNIRFPISGTHYYTLNEKMPPRNFYGNAFSLVSNAKIPASLKKWNKKLLFILCILMFRTVEKIH